MDDASSLYLVERYLPGVTREDVVAAAARAEDAARRMSSEGTVVRYVGSTFVPEDESCLCLFDGPSAEAVAEANRRAGFAFERVVPALTLGPSGEA